MNVQHAEQLHAPLFCMTEDHTASEKAVLEIASFEPVFVRLQAWAWLFACEPLLLDCPILNFVTEVCICHRIVLRDNFACSGQGHANVLATFAICQMHQ